MYCSFRQTCILLIRFVQKNERVVLEEAIMENIIYIEQKLKALEELLKQQRWDLMYWNKRTDQVRGTTQVEPVKENLEQTELEIECTEKYIKELKDLILEGEEHDEEERLGNNGEPMQNTFIEKKDYDN